jgi:hypothetical protein
MKKQIIILLLLSIQASAQNPHFPVVKISVRCTDEFINNYKGKWLIPKLEPTVNDYQGEVKKRVNKIQNLVYQTYPQPAGCDAFWSAGSAKKTFADQVKYVLVEGDWKQQTVKTNPVYSWKYSLALCGWLCHGTNEIMNGYAEIGGASLIRVDPLFTTEGPVFQSEEQGGTMLATQNPAYFRQDLPKYVPQLFVFSLSADPKGWSKDFKRIVEENFPVERLQAMIDK